MKYNCPICNAEIPEERIIFLKELNYSDTDIYCINHAVNRPIKAIYSGEVGTSDLIFCEKIYEDSVRNILYNAEQLDEPDIIEEENKEIEKE